jgi:hypothetical protein
MHGWARCFELYFLYLDFVSMKCNLLFHKRIRYGFQDIFIGCHNCLSSMHLIMMQTRMFCELDALKVRDFEHKTFVSHYKFIV